jgi:hypothetical protein
MLTRKHFEAIAKRIAAIPVSPKEKRIHAEWIADCLVETNPRFDRARFIAAATK